MRYQKIYVQIWNDEKFIELSEPSKIFFLYLLTSPHSNLIGAFVIKKGYIAEDLKWSIPRVDKAIKELVKDELILFDVKVSVVAVSNYLKYNPLENPNQFTGAVKIYKSLPRTSILSSVFNMLVTLAKRFNRPFEGASKPEAVTGTESGTEEVIEVKPKEKKNTYGEFKNVKLSDDEYKKLETKFNNSLPEKIETLSRGIASKGYKYSSHYATILTWAKNEKNEPQQPEYKQL